MRDLVIAIGFLGVALELVLVPGLDNMLAATLGTVALTAIVAHAVGPDTGGA